MQVMSTKQSQLKNVNRVGLQLVRACGAPRHLNKIIKLSVLPLGAALPVLVRIPEDRAFTVVRARFGMIVRDDERLLATKVTARCLAIYHLLRRLLAMLCAFEFTRASLCVTLVHHCGACSLL